MNVVERLRRRLGRRPYVCLGCRAALAERHHVCPDCGGYDVRRREWVEETPRA